MKPIIHTFSSATAPEPQSCVAFFYEPGKKTLTRLPMAFTAATEEAARLAAETWWAEEREKEERRHRAIAVRRNAEPV